MKLGRKQDAQIRALPIGKVHTAKRMVAASKDRKSIRQCKQRESVTRSLAGGSFSQQQCCP